MDVDAGRNLVTLKPFEGSACFARVTRLGKSPSAFSDPKHSGINDLSDTIRPHSQLKLLISPPKQLLYTCKGTYSKQCVTVIVCFFYPRILGSVRCFSL